MDNHWWIVWICWSVAVTFSMCYTWFSENENVLFGYVMYIPWVLSLVFSIGIEKGYIGKS